MVFRRGDPLHLDDDPDQMYLRNMATSQGSSSGDETSQIENEMDNAPPPQTFSPSRELSPPAQPPTRMGREKGGSQSLDEMMDALPEPRKQDPNWTDDDVRSTALDEKYDAPHDKAIDSILDMVDMPFRSMGKSSPSPSPSPHTSSPQPNLLSPEESQGMQEDLFSDLSPSEYDEKRHPEDYHPMADTTPDAIAPGRNSANWDPIGNEGAYVDYSNPDEPLMVFTSGPYAGRIFPMPPGADANYVKSLGSAFANPDHAQESPLPSGNPSSSMVPDQPGQTGLDPTTRRRVLGLK